LPEDVKVDETCKPVRKDVDCMTPGVPVELIAEDSQEFLFSITLPKASSSTSVTTNQRYDPCPEVYVGMFQATSFQGDVDFSISFSSPKVSALDENHVPDINSWNFGNDRTALAICLSSDQETTFYVSIVSYQEVPVDTWPIIAVFTPSASFYKYKLRELPFDLYNEMLIC